MFASYMSSGDTVRRSFWLALSVRHLTNCINASDLASRNVSLVHWHSLARPMSTRASTSIIIRPWGSCLIEPQHLGDLAMCLSDPRRNRDVLQIVSISFQREACRLDLPGNAKDSTNTPSSLSGIVFTGVAISRFIQSLLVTVHRSLSESG